MSKFLRNQLTWLTMAIPLVLYIIGGNPGLLMIALVLVWINNAAQGLAILAILCLIVGAGQVKDRQKLDDLLADLNRRSWVRRMLGYSETAVLIVGLAYAGAGITAFCAAMLFVGMRAALGIARERLKGAQA